MATLTKLGHACFKFENEGKSVVFDPFAPGYVPGCVLPDNLTCNLCLCSHGHNDHAYTQAVTEIGSSEGITVFSVPCYHDDKQGTLRGNNTINIVTIGGVSVCHMGDVGHELDDESYKKIGKVDVLLIPVGGYYTVDGATAKKIADSIDARIIIPMHYRVGNSGYDVISTVDDFVKLYDNVTIVNDAVLDIGGDYSGVVVMDI